MSGLILVIGVIGACWFLYFIYNKSIEEAIERDREFVKKKEEKQTITDSFPHYGFINEDDELTFQRANVKRGEYEGKYNRLVPLINFSYSRLIKQSDLNKVKHLMNHFGAKPTNKNYRPHCDYLVVLCECKKLYAYNKPNDVPQHDIVCDCGYRLIIWTGFPESS